MDSNKDYLQYLANYKQKEIYFFFVVFSWLAVLSYVISARLIAIGEQLIVSGKGANQW